MLRSRMTRRAFLTLVAGTAAGVVAAAGCGATPTATPVPPTATVVPPTKPPAPTNTPVPPAPAATTAPAAAATAVPPTAVPPTAVPPTAVPPTAVPAAATLPFDINEFTGGFVAAPESVYSYDDMSKKYTIKWMRSSWYNQGQPIPEGDPIKKYIDRVLNVDFQLLPSQVGVFQDVNLRVASGEGAPDVWWPGSLADATKLANDGVAIPDLRPYIEKYCPNYMALIAAAGGKDLFFNATTVKGKMVAFARPLFTGEPAESVFVRQDWLTKLGLQPPKTVDDLYAIAEKFKANLSTLGGKYAFTPGPTLNADAYPLAGFDGISFAFGCPNGCFQEGNTVSWGFALPGRKDFLAYVKKFVDNKMMADDWYLWQGTDGTAKMVASEIGIYSWGAWGVYTTAGLHPKFPNLKFINWLTGPGGDGRWGFMSSPGVSEQFSAALLKDEAKLKRALHIIDQFANPFSGPYKATYFRNYQMNPPWPEGICFVKELQESGPFVRVVAWTKDTMAAASADVKKTCPWFADDKLYRGIPEWRPVGISVWSKWGSYVYGPGKLEDTGNADTGVYMSNTWYPWWSQLKGQKYYTPIAIRGDSGIQADVMKQVYANELKFVLGQRPLTEWDAYVKDILTKYKATDLLKTTVTALQDQGLPITGIDPRIPV